MTKTETDTDPTGAPVGEMLDDTLPGGRRKLTKRELRELFEDGGAVAPERRAYAPSSEAAEYCGPRAVRGKTGTVGDEPCVVARDAAVGASQASMNTTISTRPLTQRRWGRVGAVAAVGGVMVVVGGVVLSGVLGGDKTGAVTPAARGSAAGSVVAPLPTEERVKSAPVASADVPSAPVESAVPAVTASVPERPAASAAPRRAKPNAPRENVEAVPSAKTPKIGYVDHL